VTRTIPCCLEPAAACILNSDMAATSVTGRPYSNVIDRRTAQVAEENFFERFIGAANNARAVPSPMDGRTYDLGPANRTIRTLDGRTEEMKAAIKRRVERDLLKTYDEMPRCGTMLLEIHRRDFLGGRDLRVVVAGASLSPVDDFLTQGSSSRPVGAADFARVRDEVVTRDDVFYFLCAFATTAWHPEARNTLAGRNYLAALCDLHEDAWRVWYAPDPRWGYAARLFDLTSAEEKIEAVRRFVERHTFELLMDELTEDIVFEHLGYAVGIIREAFEIVAAQTEFLRLETGVEPWRLVRVYV